jgi:drug/metabolite transporter (DMT)-like permease
VATLLGLLAALTYGAGDFAAGLAARNFPSARVAACVLPLEAAVVAVAVVIAPGHGATIRALAWGALSGVGGGIGTLALYRGLAAGRMAVVAPVSAVLAAVVPAVVGVALGDRLRITAVAGIVLALPAIALVSRVEDVGERSGGSGVLAGMVAGAGFALLFIALDRAGTRAGAWPALPGQVVAVAFVAPFALRADGPWRPTRRTSALLVAAGVLSAAANLLYLAATGRGALAIVAVLTSLYPAVTVLLARLLLAERWSRPQAAGLLAAVVAIVLVTVR